MPTTRILALVGMGMGIVVCVLLFFTTGAKGHPGTSLDSLMEADSHEQDVATLLEGLDMGIVSYARIGILTIFGPRAFAFLASTYQGNTTLHPVGGAARFGDGKIVIFSSHRFTNPEEGKTDDQVLRNSINWLATNKHVPRVGVLGQNAMLTRWMKTENENYAYSLFKEVSKENLDTIDVLILENLPSVSSTEKADIVKSFVRQGGGLFTAATPWDGDKIDYGNMITHEAGLGWMHEEADWLVNNIIPVTGYENLKDTHAGHAWDLLLSHIQTDFNLPTERLSQLGSLFLLTLESLPSDEPQLVQRAHKDVIAWNELIVPSEDNPISDPTEKLVLEFQVRLKYQFEKGDSDPDFGYHPAADFFPGNVTVEGIKDKHSVKLTITGERSHDWYSTGFYAPPGSEVVIDFKTQVPKSIRIQIGSHKDDLRKKINWVRYPRVVVKKTINLADDRKFRIRNTFGGLLYVTGYAQEADAILEFDVTGVVPTPSFYLGQTSLAEWNSALRHYKAPWAEIGSKKIVLTLPGDKIAQVDNPEKLLAVWDNILDAMSTFCSIPVKKPERCVADIDIGGGYMHAGYPIMMYNDEKSVDTSLSAQRMQTPDSWGQLHELGHNFQTSDWKLEGTGEVTNNVIALYAYDKVADLSPAGANPGNLNQLTINERVREYISNGTPFEYWKSSDEFALITYVHLQKTYGWEPYLEVLASYRSMPIYNGTNEITNQDKIDIWITKFSRAVGENLVPLFKSWGFPVSDSVSQELTDLRETTERIESIIVE